MADFAAVLRKTIDALKENTPEMRAKVYEKARATIDAKLAAVSPPPPQQLVERQKGLLEDAIAEVEGEYAAAAAAQEDDLDSIMGELSQSSEPAPAADEPEAEPAAPESGEEMVPAEEERPQTPEWLDSSAAEAAAEESEAEVEGGALADDRPVRARRRAGVLTVLLLLLIALGAAAYGAWFYRDDVAQLAGFQSFDQMMARDGTAPAEQAGEAPAGSDQAGEAPAGSDQAGEASAESDEAAGAPAGPDQAGGAQEETAAAQSGSQTPEEESERKFTQRLLPDGQEVDEGPAEGEPTLGEGTSVAEATQSGAPGEGGAEPQGEDSLPVGQRAIFYEERTSASQGSAESGAVVWSIAEESPGNNLPPEPAIRAEATIPEKGLQLKMTIRRNVDQSLPASHIMELIFLTPDNFPGGGIDNVLRVAMKRSEQDTGSPLLGIPAKIADGFFLVALSDSRADVETNTLLMRRQSWIDIPIVYTSGRRALITLEKGVPGEQVFTQALEAWQRASSG